MTWSTSSCTIAISIVTHQDPSDGLDLKRSAIFTVGDVAHRRVDVRYRQRPRRKSCVWSDRSRGISAWLSRVERSG